MAKSNLSDRFPSLYDRTGDIKDLNTLLVPRHEIDPIVNALQAKIDTLMLEHCPDEMSEEQKSEWAEHQRPAPAHLQMPPVTELNPVEGDLLPPVGTQVLIHLARQELWVPHTVIGYYVWGDLENNASRHRVFVRVKSRDGSENARMLCDVRDMNGNFFVKSDSPNRNIDSPIQVDAK